MWALLLGLLLLANADAAPLKRHLRLNLSPEGKPPQSMANLTAGKQVMSVRARRYDMSKFELAASQNSSKEPPHICSKYTDGKCQVFGCDAARGSVECDSNRIFNICVCKTGYCADGHGHCHSKNPAVELNKHFLIEAIDHNSWGLVKRYLYLERFGNRVKFWKLGDPGAQGHFRIVVNNDGTVMMHTVEWGTDYWLTIDRVGEKIDVNDTDAEKELKENKKRMTHQRQGSEFIPQEVSWTLHQDGEGSDIYILRHIDTSQYAEMDPEGVDATEQPNRDCHIRFHPDIKEVAKAQGVDLTIKQKQQNSSWFR